MSSALEKRRYVWMDVARVIAIVLVILTHANERAGSPCLEYKSIIYSIDRLGVPIFLMLSGGLMIPKCADCSVSDFYKKYKSRIIQFVLLLFFYALITNFVKILWVDDKTLVQTLKDFHKANGITSSSVGAAIQLWYMHVIIGFYIFLPFLSKLLSTLTTRSLFLLAGLCSLPLLHMNFFTKSTGAIAGGYLAYFVAGYLIINRLSFKWRKTAIAICALVVVCSVLWAFLVDMRKDTFQNWIHWYSSSPSIYMGSLALFIMIREAFCNARPLKIVTTLSRHSFGIYLVHYLVLWCVVKFIPASKDSSSVMVWNTIIYFVLTLSLSWLYTAIVIRMPFLRKLVA